MIITQRSALETGEHCERKHYWAYCHNGRGLERKALSVPLLTGSLIHEPLAEVLKAAQLNPQVDPGHVRWVVSHAQRNYLEAVRDRGLLLDSFDGSDEQLGQVLKYNALDPASPVAWQINEQLALIEALVKGWTRVRLPVLLKEYQIVDVEQEQEVRLSDEVIMLTRRDALLRRRQSGELFVLSFKTTSNPDKTWIEQFRYDQQTISEFVAAEQSLKEGGLEGVVRGVLVEGLVKGQRKIKWPEDADPAQWRHNSPLLYHYATPANPPMPQTFRADYYWHCTEPHKFQYAKGGVCPGGKKHQIGKEFQREMVSQTCGFDAWLEWLSENEPETLRAQFISLPAILRSEWEIERWKKMAIARATASAEAAASLEAGGDIDIQFPMSTASGKCLRPSRCPFLELCWGSADPDDLEQFVPRRFNHPAEAGLIKLGEARGE